MDNPKTAWVAGALDDLENSSLSYDEIAKKYGRHRSTIQKLKYNFNITRKQRPKFYGLRKTIDLVSLSPEHRAIGMSLTRFRSDKTISTIANALGVSQRKMKLMELGVHDFTLTELKKISAMMNAPIQNLVAPVNEKFVRRVR